MNSRHSDCNFNVLYPTATTLVLSLRTIITIIQNKFYTAGTAFIKGFSKEKLHHIFNNMTFRSLFISICNCTHSSFIPRHTIVAGYYGFTLVVRVSVRFSFPDDNLSKHKLIFTKLGMCIDIVEIWFGIANGQISSNFDGVICPRHAHVFVSV